jgi:hypothetical protein
MVMCAFENSPQFQTSWKHNLHTLDMVDNHWRTEFEGINNAAGWSFVINYSFLFLNLHSGIILDKYIICRSFNIFQRAFFSIVYPKYSNFGGILDARW